MRDGDVVFVRMGVVEQWAKEVLPRLNTTFVLVTHDGDEFAPPGVKSSGMLDHELLLHWFSVNADRSHPRLTAVPIGLMDSRHLAEGQHSADRAKLEKYIR